MNMALISPGSTPFGFNLNRRRFLQTTSAGLAMSALGSYGTDLVNQKPKRVGIIGVGWYGKSDLWRLVQVAPVDIVAIEKRSRPVADIEQGHISTASCILANVAMELGRSITYDPKSRKIADDREANRRLRQPYRQPWKHPGAA